MGSAIIARGGASVDATNKVGDIKFTTNTSVGKNWALCNGGLAPEDSEYARIHAGGNTNARNFKNTESYKTDINFGSLYGASNMSSYYSIIDKCSYIYSYAGTNVKIYKHPDDKAFFDGTNTEKQLLINVNLILENDGLNPVIDDMLITDDTSNVYIFYAGAGGQEYSTPYTRYFAVIDKHTKTIVKCFSLNDFPPQSGTIASQCHKACILNNYVCLFSTDTDISSDIRFSVITISLDGSYTTNEYIQPGNYNAGPNGTSAIYSYDLNRGGTIINNNSLIFGAYGFAYDYNSQTQYSLYKLIHIIINDDGSIACIHNDLNEPISTEDIYYKLANSIYFNDNKVLISMYITNNNDCICSKFHILNINDYSVKTVYFDLEDSNSIYIFKVFSSLEGFIGDESVGITSSCILKGITSNNGNYIYLPNVIDIAEKMEDGELWTQYKWADVFNYYDDAPGLMSTDICNLGYATTRNNSLNILSNSTCKYIILHSNLYTVPESLALPEISIDDECYAFVKIK